MVTNTIGRQNWTLTNCETSSLTTNEIEWEMFAYGRTASELEDETEEQPKHLPSGLVILLEERI